MYKEAKENVKETHNTGLEFWSFAENESVDCHGTLYSDDGESREFESGKFAIYKLSRNGIVGGGDDVFL